MSSDYEIIEFNNRVGATVRQRGRKVRDDLVVAFSNPYIPTKVHKVYSIISGRPVVDVGFSDIHEAIRFAEWLDDIYHDYWCLLTEYPRMDIPAVCRWTVEDGTNIHRTLVSLTSLRDRDTITLNDLRVAGVLSN